MAATYCVIEGCGSLRKKLQMCKRHYREATGEVWRDGESRPAKERARSMRPRQRTARDYSDLPVDAKLIPGCSHYWATPSGEIWSTCGSRAIQRATRIKLGYRVLTIRRSNGSRWTIAVHLLVARTFLGEPGVGMQARHLDGNPLNNHVDNLQWGTVLENARDRIRHGTQQRGAGHWNAKMTDDAVRDMRERHARGESYHSLAKAFGVTHVNVMSICKGQTWRHVEMPQAS